MMGPDGRLFDPAAPPIEVVQALGFDMDLNEHEWHGFACSTCAFCIAEGAVSWPDLVPVEP